MFQVIKTSLLLCEFQVPVGPAQEENNEQNRLKMAFDHGLLPTQPGAWCGGHIPLVPALWEAGAEGSRV